MASKTALKYENTNVTRLNRELQWVRLGQMRVTTEAQRIIRPAWVDELASDMDLDKLGTPELSFRDGHYNIMDGNHRVKALIRFLGDNWEESKIQCWVARGLTEKEEAKVFLALNHRKAVDAFEKFKVSVCAGLETEVSISQIVAKLELRISKQKLPGAVGCVGTLIKVYDRLGADTLTRALLIAREAYGDAGFTTLVIEGFGLLAHRYNGVLDEQSAIAALSHAHGGVNGLLNRAEQLRQKTGHSKAECVAAGAVSIINGSRTGRAKPLVDWWK